VQGVEEEWIRVVTVEADRAEDTTVAGPGRDWRRARTARAGRQQIVVGGAGGSGLPPAP